MPVRKDVEITIKGKDKLTPATKSARKGLKALGITATAFTAAGLAILAAKAARAGIELVKLGAQSLAARERLVAFAGGASRADEMLKALVASSDGIIDRMTAMAMASRLVEQGLVSTGAEMGIAGAMVGKLGNQAWTTERRMQSLTMLLSVQSKLRLDDFGLSVAAVTARQKELEKQGYSTEQAFKAAVFAEAESKLGILGDTSDSLTTQIGHLDAAWTNLRLIVADNIADTVEQSGAFETLAGKIDLVTEALENYDVGIGEIRRAQALFWVSEEAAARAIERHTAAVAELASKEEYLTAVRRAVELIPEPLEALLPPTDKLEDLHRRYYEHLQDITYTAAQKASRTYIEELSKAQQAALAILASEIDARNWQSSLEGMYQQHLDRLASIRDSYRESEQQKENTRYQAIVTRLNEEYQARKAALDKQHRALLDSIDREHQAKLDALNREYGKAVSGEDRREQLEEEHRRRLMGIYTESARKQEKKRHAAALKELEYEEKKAAIEAEYQEQKRKAAEDYEAAQAALEKEFQSRKEAAAAKHEAHLKQIAERAMAAELAREQQRYQDEVNAAIQRRTLQQQDEARRLAIIQQYEAQRRAERAVMRAREEAHQAMLEARWQAAHRRQIVDLWEAHKKIRDLRIAERNEAVAAHREALARARELKEAIQGIPTGPGWGGVAKGYQHGGITSGGTVLVGEAGPELLNLPGGTRITPLTGGGVTPIVIHNHFGASSVRSERDIRRIAELQERTLRLRGQGVVS